jgi:hypothetical protein
MLNWPTSIRTSDEGWVRANVDHQFNSTDFSGRSLL